MLTPLYINIESGSVMQDKDYVFIVLTCCKYYPDDFEVDSVWATKEDALRRADQEKETRMIKVYEAQVGDNKQPPVGVYYDW